MGSIQVKGPERPGATPVVVWVDRVEARFLAEKIKPGLWWITFKTPQIVIRNETSIIIEWQIVH